jgi:hypothetical protein
MRRRVGAVAVVALLVVTLGLVVTAMRPRTPPPAPASPPGQGTLAQVGDPMWRWLGPSECTPAADAVPIERSSNGTWLGADVPLVTVDSLSFANADEGIAVGTSSNCARATAVTRDGGQTWVLSAPSPPMLDGVLTDNGVAFGVTRGAQSGETLVARYTLVDGRLAPGSGVDGSPVDGSPCDATDGVPTLVAAYSASTVLLLCQQGPSNGRLLARSVSGGQFWDRLTDNRPLTGLDGSGTFTRLRVAGTSDVWVVMQGAGCPEGEIRRSINSGQVFEPLPCPSSTADVSEVFDLAFSDADNGTLLGLDGNRAPVMLTTSDGGQTWTNTRSGL